MSSLSQSHMTVCVTEMRDPSRASGSKQYPTVLIDWNIELYSSILYAFEPSNLLLIALMKPPTQKMRNTFMKFSNRSRSDMIASDTEKNRQMRSGPQRSQCLS